MKASLLMAIHFHQPVGNFDKVIDRASSRCYVPFLKTLKEYPDIKMTFHFTGCLMEWAEKKRPEIIEFIKGMVKSGQVELMTGGFYEPILTSIPKNDILSQISLLTEYNLKKFGARSSGAWIAERVWEPSLASILHESGVKYIILDDTHFLYAGIKKENTYGFYMTEHNSKPVAVFPSDKNLRYSIPFMMPGENMEYMRKAAASKDNPVFIYGDDGEKFGEWPGTEEWVYKEGWLRKFFDEIMKNKSWLETTTFYDYMDRNDPIGNVYLPGSSYSEMLEWALPTEIQENYENIVDEVKRSGNYARYGQFLRGGFWSNFLTKYPESNHMHKKMIYVSKKAASLKRKGVSKRNLAAIKNRLFRGQCNCAYWHGVFGGLYLFHLRQAIYKNLIQSENLIDKALYGKNGKISGKITDFDGDGFKEAIIETNDLSLYFAPSKGGSLTELDARKEAHNMINTLARRKEAYHRRILEKIENGHDKDYKKCKTIHDAIEVEDDRIKDYLIYDKYPRYSLIDHFISPGDNVEAFNSGNYKEEGDFSGGEYSASMRKKKDGIILTMRKAGNVKSNSVIVEKRITARKKRAAFDLRYLVKNESKEILTAIFAPEFNFTMPYCNSLRYVIKINGKVTDKGLNATLEYKNIKSFEIQDNESELSFKICFDKECRLWHFPLITVSQSETSYELNYQGSVIIPSWPMEISYKTAESLSISIAII